jgi:hypothetical protein
MSQVVTRRPHTAEARVSPCGVCGGQSGTGTSFLRAIRVSPFGIIPPWLSILIYHLGYEEHFRSVNYWPQFRDTVLSYRHEQHEQDVRTWLSVPLFF